MKKFYSAFFLFVMTCISAHASSPREISIIGGGIAGALESYYAYQEARQKGEKVFITVYEKGDSYSASTAYNIVASLTPDEILSVVPRGSELMEKLAILFSQPGGIRVDDVDDVNDSLAAIEFKKSVSLYGSDKAHNDRTQTLLRLGNKSMELWQEIYDQADIRLKNIFHQSNFNACRELTSSSNSLHDGYRIDLIYGIARAANKAAAMKADYEKLGYQHCAILSPQEVIALDPSLENFCNAHSEVNSSNERVWEESCTALWRPGGCLDTYVFIPLFYAYLKDLMGQCEGENHQMKDCFTTLYRTKFFTRHRNSL